MYVHKHPCRSEQDKVAELEKQILELKKRLSDAQRAGRENRRTQIQDGGSAITTPVQTPRVEGEAVQNQIQNQGQIQAPGPIQSPAGQPQQNDGQIEQSIGQNVQSSGQIEQSTDQNIQSSGQIEQSTGQIEQATGQIQGKGGQTPTQSSKSVTTPVHTPSAQASIQNNNSVITPIQTPSGQAASQIQIKPDSEIQADTPVQNADQKPDENIQNIQDNTPVQRAEQNLKILNKEDNKEGKLRDM
jgi:hypothetical protein